MKHIVSLNLNTGQALISLLFFTIVAITVTSSAVVVVLVNSISASKLQQGNLALSTAESGIENSLLRLLRDPNYSGETLAIGEGIVVATVSGESQKTIIAQATEGNFLRKIQVEAEYNNNILTILSWKEVF